MNFTITDDHIKLLNKYRKYNPEDLEGDQLYNQKRPFGNSDIDKDVCEALGFEKVEAGYETTYLTKDLEYSWKTYKELERVLEIEKVFGELKAGTYKIEYIYQLEK